MSNERIKSLVHLQEKIRWSTIRRIMTSTLLPAFSSSTSAGWKTRCSPKSVSSTLYPPPVSHITGRHLKWAEIFMTIVSRALHLFIFCPFRIRLWCRESSSSSADHRDSSEDRDRCHEIPVRLPKPVSLVAAALRGTALLLWCSARTSLQAFLSTVMRTWWTLTTWLSALGPRWCPYQTTRIQCPAKHTLTRSLRRSSCTMRPSFRASESWRDLFMRSAWREGKSTGRWKEGYLKNTFSCILQIMTCRICNNLPLLFTDLNRTFTTKPSQHNCVLV